MWELDCEESWAPKNFPKLPAFELWCWRRLLRVPWTAKRSNQSILKEISPGCSLEGLMLKPVLWPPHVKSWLIEKDPNAGKDWGQEGEGDGWMASPTWWSWVWVDSGSWWWTGSPGMLRFMGSQRVGHDWVTELNWMPLLISVITVLMLLMITPCIINCLTHFASAQVNKLQYAVPIQTTPNHRKYHSPLDQQNYKDSKAWD